MAMVDLKKLQPQYDDYLRANEHWGQVSKPGLEAFMSGDPDRMAADEETVNEARLACFYAANELAERLREVISAIPAEEVNSYQEPQGSLMHQYVKRIREAATPD